MNRDLAAIRPNLPGIAINAPMARRYGYIRKAHIFLGMLGLAAGFFYYAAFRQFPPALVQAVVGSKWRLAWDMAPWRTALDSFPSCIHVFAFSVLTVAILDRPTVRSCLWIVLGWTSVNVGFESLQGLDHEAFLHFMSRLPWRMDSLVAFVVGGVFDIWDVVAAVVGGVAAFAAAVFIIGKGEKRAV
jgi:hypothetical protein